MNAYALVVAGLLPGCGTWAIASATSACSSRGLPCSGWPRWRPPIRRRRWPLIGGRALLAVGAAMMMPATLSIIRLAFG